MKKSFRKKKNQHPGKKKCWQIQQTKKKKKKKKKVSPKFPSKSSCACAINCTCFSATNLPMHNVLDMKFCS